MLTNKEMRKAALDNVKTNLGPSISLSLVLGLFIMMLTSIGAAENAQFGLIIVVPLVMMPLLFATQVAHFALRENFAPSLKVYFGYFISYFGFRYRGVFRFIKSFLSALVFFIFSLSLLLPISGSITNALYPGFNDVFTQLNDLMLASNLEAIMELFEDNQAMLATYVNIGALPALGIALFMFVYFITKNSIQFYTRMRRPLALSQINNIIAQRADLIMAVQIRKSYWALNFPLFILLVVGFAGGTLIGSIFTINLNYLATIGVASAVLLMMFFFPFYFSNMEQIYIANKDMYESASKKISDDLAANLESQLNILRKDEDIIDLTKQAENENKEEEK